MILKKNARISNKQAEIIEKKRKITATSTHNNEHYWIDELIRYCRMEFFKSKKKKIEKTLSIDISNDDCCFCCRHNHHRIELNI